MTTSSHHELVTVATYWDPMEAQIARLRLAHEGIPAFLEKEFTVQTAWLYTNAIGGVRLMVPAPMLDEACRLLAIKVLFSDWRDSRCWEASLNGIPVVTEVEEVAMARDREFSQPLSPREELADRALRAAVLGLRWEITFLFSCVHLWRFYNTEGACRPAYLRKADWAWRITTLVAAFFLVAILLAWASLTWESYVPSTIHDEQVKFSPPINALRP